MAIQNKSSKAENIQGHHVAEGLGFLFKIPREQKENFCNT